MLKLHSTAVFSSACLRDKRSRNSLIDLVAQCNIKNLKQCRTKNMKQRTRKLFGTVFIVVIAMLYAVISTTIAAAKLSDASGWVHLVYFFFTGMLWIVPAMFIINWMLKPDKEPEDS